MLVSGGEAVRTIAQSPDVVKASLGQAIDARGARPMLR